MTHSAAANTVFDETVKYLYRVRAKNNVGMATLYSPVLTVQPDTRPIGMYKPKLGSVTPSVTNVYWDALLDPVLNGGDVPIWYGLETSHDNITWTVVNNGYPLTFSWNHGPGTVLTTLRYYRVRAENGVGMSNIYSEVLAVTAPANYTPVACSINPKDITICWWEGSTQWALPSLPSFYQLEWIDPTGYGSDCSSVPTSLRSSIVNPTDDP